MGVCISSDDKYFHMKSGIGERGNSIGDLHHECRGTRYSYFGFALLLWLMPFGFRYDIQWYLVH
jgi:hypothetical protein